MFYAETTRQQSNKAQVKEHLALGSARRSVMIDIHGTCSEVWRLSKREGSTLRATTVNKRARDCHNER